MSSSPLALELYASDWKQSFILDLSIFVKDGTHGTHVRVTNGIPLLSAKNITPSGKVKWDENDSQVSTEDYWKIHSKYQLQSDDLLLTVVGTLGRCALVTENIKYTIQRSVAVIRCKTDKIVPSFLFHYARTDYFQRQLSLRSNATAQAGVYLGELGKIPAPLPPLPEQQKIAQILMSVDEVIEKTQTQIDKLKDLKTAMMQELLTKGIGHVEFKDSPAGRIPIGWDVVTVGTLADVIDPQPDHRTPAEVENGIPYVGLGDIDKSGFIDFNGARKVSQEAFDKQLKSFDIHEQAFIFGKIGTIGNPCILPKKRFYCLSANIVLITTSNLLNMRYLYHLFMSGVIDAQVAMQTNTTSQPALGIKKVREFLVPVPSDEKEKQKLVETLSSVDRKIMLVKQKLTLLNNKKKALLQDLLTGKVRVNTEQTNPTLAAV